MSINRLAVLVSGGGTNLQQIINGIEAGEIPASVCVVISDRPDVYALERAAKHGIPHVTVDRKAFASVAEHNAAVLKVLKEYEAEGIVLAGYLSILSGEIVSLFRHRIVNTHPALIPSFCGMGYYGERVHKAALDYGVKLSGATVHFVDEGTDTGPIIMQESVPVMEDDDPASLAKRVLTAEHRILPAAVKLLCEGRLAVDGRRVRILPANE